MVLFMFMVVLSLQLDLSQVRNLKTKEESESKAARLMQVTIYSVQKLFNFYIERARNIAKFIDLKRWEDSSSKTLKKKKGFFGCYIYVLDISLVSESLHALFQMMMLFVRIYLKSKI